MQLETRLVLLASSLVFSLASVTAVADPFERRNWIPSGNYLFFEQGGTTLGDMWTFVCPAGGSVQLSVDTMNDSPTGARIDPGIAVWDAEGNLIATGDDDFDCTYTPNCGFSCPAVDVPCGKGIQHSVSIFSVLPNQGCEGGGGYVLGVEVKNRLGRSFRESRVKLGGGVNGRGVPEWFDTGKGLKRPAALDDEAVPTWFLPLSGEASATATDAASRTSNKLQ